MIFDTLNRLGQYRGICAGLDKLIDFTLAHDLNALPAGRNEIDGDLAWMNVNVAPLVYLIWDGSPISMPMYFALPGLPTCQHL